MAYYIIALAIVLLLILLCFKLLRYFSGSSNPGSLSKYFQQGNLKVTEQIFLDNHSKIITVTRSNTSYIIYSGKHNEFLIDKYENDN